MLTTETTFQYSPTVAFGTSTDTRYGLVDVTGTLTTLIHSTGTATGNYALQYKLTIATSPTSIPASAISLQPSSSDSYYFSGTIVTLTANAVAIDATHYASFDRWNPGANHWHTNPTTVTMNSATTITAQYSDAQAGIVVGFSQTGLDNTADEFVVNVDGPMDQM